MRTFIKSLLCCTITLHSFAELNTSKAPAKVGPTLRSGFNRFNQSNKSNNAVSQDAKPAIDSNHRWEFTAQNKHPSATPSPRIQLGGYKTTQINPHNNEPDDETVSQDEPTLIDQNDPVSQDEYTSIDQNDPVSQAKTTLWFGVNKTILPSQPDNRFDSTVSQDGNTSVAQNHAWKSAVPSNDSSAIPKTGIQIGLKGGIQINPLFAARKASVLRNLQKLKENYMKCKELVEKNFGEFFNRFTHGSLGMRDTLNFFDKFYSDTNNKDSKLVKAFLDKAINALEVRDPRIVNTEKIPYRVLKGLVVEKMTEKEIRIQSSVLIGMLNQFMYGSTNQPAMYNVTIGEFDKTINYVQSLQAPIKKQNSSKLLKLLGALTTTERLTNIMVGLHYNDELKYLLNNNFNGLLSFLELCAFFQKQHNLLKSQADVSKIGGVSGILMLKVLSEDDHNADIIALPDLPNIDFDVSKITITDTTINSILEAIEKSLSLDSNVDQNSISAPSRLLNICTNTKIMAMISNATLETYGPLAGLEPKIKKILVENALMDQEDNELIMGLCKLAKIINQHRTEEEIANDNIPDPSEKKKNKDRKGFALPKIFLHGQKQTQ